MEEKTAQQPDGQAAIRDFLQAMAKKHGRDVNKIMLGLSYGDLNVWVYDEGAANVFTQVEILHNPTP